jgi:hypothetical protein
MLLGGIGSSLAWRKDDDEFNHDATASQRMRPPSTATTAQAVMAASQAH